MLMNNAATESRMLFWTVAFFFLRSGEEKEERK